MKKWIKWSAVTAILLPVFWFSEAITYAFVYGLSVLKAEYLQPSDNCKDVVFSLETGSVLRCDVQIPAKHTYQISLSFIADKNDRVERRRIREIVDPKIENAQGKVVKLGVPIKLRVLVEDEDGNRALDGIIESPESNGANRDFIFVSVLVQEFSRGKYSLTIENLEAAPELKDVPALFNFELYMPN